MYGPSPPPQRSRHHGVGEGPEKTAFRLANSTRANHITTNYTENQTKLIVTKLAT